MADIAHATPAFNLVAIDIARYWNYVLIETAATWTKEPERFTVSPLQHTVGLNT